MQHACLAAGATADTTLSAVRDEMLCKRHCIAEIFAGRERQTAPKEHTVFLSRSHHLGMPMGSFEPKQPPLMWKGAYAGERCSFCTVAVLTGLTYSGRPLLLDLGLCTLCAIHSRHSKGFVLTVVRGESQQFESLELAREV